MFRSSTKIASTTIGIVVAIGMIAVAIIVMTQGSAYAESKTRGEIGEECDGYLTECNEGCDVDWSPEGEADGSWQQCYKDCQEKRQICSKIEIDDESSTGTTGTPPKGPLGVINPIRPGVIKDPEGGGKPPKAPVVVNPIPPGVIKDPEGGKPPKGPLGVNPISPDVIKDPGEGGKPPKGPIVTTPPIPPGVIKDPGEGGKPPKGPVVVHPIPPGVIKDPDGSGGSGTTTIYNSQGNEKQIGSGTGTQTIGKVKVDTGKIQELMKIAPSNQPITGTGVSTQIKRKPVPDWQKVMGSVSQHPPESIGSANQSKGKVNTGAVGTKQFNKSWSSPSTSGGTKKLERTDNQPKNKVKVDTGTIKIKQFNESWSSPSSSGGTKMMERSGSGKKKQ